jgi:hypothetical protein
MSPNEVKEIATAAAREAVRETLLSIGWDVHDPIKAQESFATFRKVVLDPDFPKDMAHVRKWRLAAEQIETKGLLTAVAILIASALGLFWVGFKTKLGLG